jgi:hypothetical protein
VVRHQLSVHGARDGGMAAQEADEDLHC